MQINIARQVNRLLERDRLDDFGVTVEKIDRYM